MLMGGRLCRGRSADVAMYEITVQHEQWLTLAVSELDRAEMG